MNEGIWSFSHNFSACSAIYGRHGARAKSRPNWAWKGGPALSHSAHFSTAVSSDVPSFLWTASSDVVPSPLLFVARAGLRVRISAQRNRFAYTYQSVLCAEFCYRSLTRTTFSADHRESVARSFLSFLFSAKSCRRCGPTSTAMASEFQNFVRQRHT